MITLAKARKLTRKHKKSDIRLSLDVIAFIDKSIKEHAEAGEYSTTISYPQESQVHDNFSVKDLYDILLLYEAYGYSITMQYTNMSGVSMIAYTINSSDCLDRNIKEITEIKISWAEDITVIN